VLLDVTAIATVNRDSSDDVTAVVLPSGLESLVSGGAIGEAAGILWYREAGEIVYPAGAATTTRYDLERLLVLDAADLTPGGE
jgi:hypothetical protein